MRRIVFCVLWAVLWGPHISPFARAQSSASQQFWPALNFHKSVSTFSRFSLEARQTRENQTGEDAQIGAFLDLYVKPLMKLQSTAFRSSDASKPRLLQLRAGYQYLRSTDNPPENRIVLATTPRLPLVLGMVGNNRNRVDLRFISGQFSWRYRNRFMVERSFAIGAHDFTPYARAEAFYDSRYEKWSRATCSAGATFALQKHVEVEAYFEHQNDSSSVPNRQINALSLGVNLFF